MALRIFGPVTLAVTLAISGCSFVGDSLWPSLSGSEPEPPLQQQAIAASQGETQQSPTIEPALTAAPPPALGTTNFQPTFSQPAQPTGTFVGQKITQLRGELIGLQRNIGGRNQQLQQIRSITAQNAQRYHGTVAAVQARLQLGTTPGNPVLINQWNEAQGDLDRLSGDIAAMNSLANLVATDSSLSSFILESVRATYGLSGAIDEDHRQLAILEDETNQTVVLIDRLLNELSEDVSRQTAYVGNERRNLTTLSLAVKNGELLGTSIVNRAYASAAPLSSSPPANATRSFASQNRRPLVVIRFDRPDPPYQRALYTAVSQVVEQRPTAQFDLVAVTPNQGTPADVALNSSQAKKQAESVLRSLTDMGLPADRVSLSSMTSTSANTNEVHIYMR
ncbi:MAG: hypothetical protein O3A21_01925 [Proteobacteria bacterium]|nr:hypothetical protein [Pseudomonadota bacterium]